MSQFNCNQIGSISLPAALAEIAFLLRAEEEKKGFRNVNISVTETSVNMSINIPATLSRKGGQLVLTVSDYIDLPIQP